MQGRPLAALALLAVLLSAGCVAGGEPLDRGDVRDAPVDRYAMEWAPRQSALITPGTPIRTAEGDCPSNFVFVRPDNTSVFLGTTANCVRALPIGSLATIGGEENLAILVYSSWITMEEKGEKDENALEYNDFAVFRIDTSSRKHVNPELPGTGGPSALADGASIQTGARVRTFTPHAPTGAWREGVVAGEAGEWALLSYNLLPGAPGSMGGAVLDPQGRAVGVMVTLGVLPNPGANGVARLDTVMEYARLHAKLDMELVTSAYRAP